VADGCRLVNPVAIDTVVTYDDVELPAGRMVDELRAEQEKLFS
jgi:predicted homoserine dehydrogenase-like protein